LDVSFTESYFLDRRLAAGIDFFLRDTNFIESGYRQKSYGSSLRTAFPITEYVVMNVSYSLRKDNVLTSSFTDSPYISNNSGNFLTSAINYGLTYNSLDNRQKPNRGQLASVSQQVAGLGGNEKYLKTLASYDFFYPVYKFWILNLSAEAGHTEGLGRNIRLNNRFFLGNPKIRGFKESGIGPRESSDRYTEKFDGFNIGGNTYYKGSAELFIPLGGGARDLGIEASVYADVGAVFNVDAEDSLISQSGLLYTLLGNNATPRVAVGIGFSWQSPFGPFRIDLAKAVKSQESDETEFFQFNVGTRF
jgi:outer membrane protein insertion porin family